MPHLSRSFVSLSCILLVLNSTVGCVVGPKTEMKTPLSALNGENYDTSPDGKINQILIPIVHTKARATRIRGRVLQRDGIVEVPLKNVKVGIYAKGSLLKESTTDLNGDFALSGVFKNGTYQLKLISSHFSAERSVDVSSYEVENVILEAVISATTR